MTWTIDSARLYTKYQDESTEMEENCFLPQGYAGSSNAAFGSAPKTVGTEAIDCVPLRRLAYTHVMKDIAYISSIITFMK